MSRCRRSRTRGRRSGPAVQPKLEEIANRPPAGPGTSSGSSCSAQRVVEAEPQCRWPRPTSGCRTLDRGLPSCLPRHRAISVLDGGPYASSPTNGPKGRRHERDRRLLRPARRLRRLPRPARLARAPAARWTSGRPRPRPDFAGKLDVLHAQTGAHEVHGAIRIKWSQPAAPSFLGYPVTDETSRQRRWPRALQPLEGGSIYRTPQTDAHDIHGDIRGNGRAWAGRRASNT